MGTQVAAHDGIAFLCPHDAGGRLAIVNGDVACHEDWHHLVVTEGFKFVKDKLAEELCAWGTDVGEPAALPCKETVAGVVEVNSGLGSVAAPIALAYGCPYRSTGLPRVQSGGSRTFGRDDPFLHQPVCRVRGNGSDTQEAAVDNRARRVDGHGANFEQKSFPPWGDRAVEQFVSRREKKTPSGGTNGTKKVCKKNSARWSK